MPTYEYRCAAGHHFEQFQRMSEPPVERCPECGEPAERQLSAGAGLLFKGSGFYITDYRSDSYKKAAAADSGGGESKAGESKTGESKAGESKAGESKAGDAKSGDTGSKSSPKSDTKSGGDSSKSTPKGGSSAKRAGGGSGS
jgi:putative FmdB family regulatory protein